MPFYSKECSLNGFLVYKLHEHTSKCLADPDLHLKVYMLRSFTSGSEISARLILGMMVLC